MGYYRTKRESIGKQYKLPYGWMWVDFGRWAIKPGYGGIKTVYSKSHHNGMVHHYTRYYIAGELYKDTNEPLTLSQAVNVLSTNAIKYIPRNK